LPPYNRTACKFQESLGRGRCQERETGSCKLQQSQSRGTTPQKPVAGECGWIIADLIRASGEGRKMFLTSPFIEQAWVLKNSFSRNLDKKVVRKSLNVRWPQTLKLAEITDLVPFSTPTPLLNSSRHDLAIDVLRSRNQQSWPAMINKAKKRRCSD
jgi:hypothetical protein